MPRDRPACAVGVDACARGWVAVVLRGSATPEVSFLATIGELGALAPDAAAVGIDIPVGLPERGVRRSDAEAWARLGPRRSSFFATPVRAAVEATTYEAASAAQRARAGSGLSRQSYALRAKILEVDAWRDEAPAPVHEVHPELSFAALLGRPASAPKKTWQGMVERRRGLEQAGIVLDGIPAAVGALAAVDDVLDAAVVAWSSQRIAVGTARPLPDPPEVGERGERLAVWI